MANQPEDLSIYIKADGAPAAAAEVKSVVGAVQSVKPAADSTAAAVETLSKRMQQFSRITSIVSAGTAIIFTLRKIAEAVDAVIKSFSRDTIDIRVGNLTSMVNGLAEAYGRVTKEIGRTADAQERSASLAEEAAKQIAERQLAQVDKEVATALLRNPENRDAIMADATVRKRAITVSAGQEGEESAYNTLNTKIGTAEERVAAAKQAGENAYGAGRQAEILRDELDWRIKENTGLKMSDVFSGKFAESERYAAAAKTYEPMMKAVEDAASKALAAMQKARDDEAAAQAEIDALRESRAAIERAGVIRRIKDETAEIQSRVDAAAAAKQKAKDVGSELDAFFGDIDKDGTAKKRAEIRKNTAAKIDAITVDAPRASSAYGAIGGMMGAQANNAERMRDQRAAALEAINREQLTLLGQIKENLDE